MTIPARKTRQKRSIIWRLPKVELDAAVAASDSLNAVLIYLKLDNKSSSYKTLKARLISDNIDFVHIKLGKGATKGRHFVSKHKIDLSDILVENSTYDRVNLKKRLIKIGLLKNQCNICGQLPEWNGSPLTLQIDHINGISDDNRLENLRILCPHCHSQTDNFAGRNVKHKKSERSLRVPNPNWRRAPRLNTRKVERPSREELEKLLWERPTTAIAKEFRVSDQAIAKWAKSYGLSKPTRGYWS